MTFTSQENQGKIISLMETIEDMHRRADMTLSQADQVELVVAFMIRHLLASYGDNVVMSYDMAAKLYRVSNAPSKQYTVRLMPFNMVITYIYLTQNMEKEFIVVHPDGSSKTYNDFDELLRTEVPGGDWTRFEYIKHLFSLGWRTQETYKWAQTWSKGIISNCWRDYYGGHDFIFSKLEPAVTKFIDNAPIGISLGDIVAVINSVN